MNLEPIDTSTTAGKARVMQLAAEGRKVVSRLVPIRTGSVHGTYNEWEENAEPMWQWPYVEYAIIAEPVGPDEVWAKVDGHFFHVSTSKEVIDAWVAGSGGMAVRYIRADLAGEAS